MLLMKILCIIEVCLSVSEINADTYKLSIRTEL